MELNRIYHPITSTPFRQDEAYAEFEPCDALKPYIRCFWGAKTESVQGVNRLVIPDTCTDIMFTVDYANNQIRSGFCGIDDRTFIAEGGNGKIFTFGIRFYAWTTSLFAEDMLKNTKNTFFDVGCHFPKIKKEIESFLFEINDIHELILLTEQVLLKHFREKHKNEIVLEAVYKMLQNRGNLPVNKLAGDMYISDRQLERLFQEYIGVSVKGLVSVIRYQYLWQEIVYNRNFNKLDAVERYGYFDQSHMQNDFKKYHSMSIKEAEKYAFENVGNLHENVQRV